MVASTTSTQDSGLFGHILPMFKAKTGIDVKVVAQGTGQALDTGAPRRRRRRVRPRQTAEEKFLVRRLRRQALPRHVQRLRPDRPEERSGRHQGLEGHRRCARRRSRTRAPLHLARRQVGHASGRAQSLEGRRHRHRQGQGPLVQGDRPGHGRGAQHRVGLERLCARRSRHLAVVQEPRRPRDRRSKATSGCSTSTASCW